MAPVSHIINLSLHNATFPDDFKTARVIPLYKKGDRFAEGNYRPVSILPVMSKIFERVVYDQVYEYLDQNNILYQNQSGFRSGYSTNTALTYLNDRIKFNMDQGKMSGLILIDIQKAFDTVNHDILCKKLNAVGLNGNSVSWFKSYLNSRSQFVQVGNNSSDHNEVTCGVPQGSILGPLLFLLYVNDMEQAVLPGCELFLYADDSALMVSGKNLSEIE